MNPMMSAGDAGMSSTDMVVRWTRPEGGQEDFTDPQEAMAAWWKAGQVGSLKHVDRAAERAALAGSLSASATAQLAPVGVVLEAALVGYADHEDANLVLDAGEDSEDELPTSFYDTLSYASIVKAWCDGAGLGVRLVDLRGHDIRVDQVRGVTVVCSGGEPISAQALDDLLGFPLTGASLDERLGLTLPSPASPRIELVAGLPRTVAPAGVHSATAAARIREDDALLDSIGLARPSGNYNTNPLVKTKGGYTPGTAVVGAGYENLATARRTWESMPLTEDACTFIVDKVRAERRQDVKVRVGDLTIDEDGAFLVGGTRYPMEMNGYLTLLARINGIHVAGEGPLFPGAGRYLMQLPVDERVWNVRKGLGRANASDELVWRMHHVEGVEQCYAVVSEGYKAHDADCVADAIRTLVKGKGYRGEAGYECGSTDLYVEATYHADAKRLNDFAAGDLTQIGYRFKSNDASGGSINGGAMGRWNGCLNYIIIEEGTGSTFRVIHRGNVGALVGDMMGKLARMQPVFDRFARRWGVLRSKPVRDVKLWGTALVTGRDALTHIVEEGKLDVGVSGDKLTKFLHDAWEREAATSGPADSLARVMAALTRAAHESLVDDCKRDVWERRSGALVPVLARFAEAQA